MLITCLEVTLLIPQLNKWEEIMMINNRGQNLSIPSSSALVKDNIYVAKLHSVGLSDFEDNKGSVAK